MAQKNDVNSEKWRCDEHKIAENDKIILETLITISNKPAFKFNESA